MKGKIVAMLTLAIVFAMLVSPVLAAPAPPKAPAPPAGPAALTQSTNASGPARYFVILADPSVPSYTGGIEGLAATNPAANGEVKFDADSRESRAYASYLEAQQDALVAEASRLLARSPEVVYQLQFALNAVVMVLDPAEAALIAKLPGVIQVERDIAEQIDTDYGPSWIGAPSIWNGTATGGLPGTKGEGIIIGDLDTGINMDHPSFAATGADGFTHTNPFGAGNYKGWCNPGYPVTVTCNAKLVGAWDYADASWGETDGPEDNHGHGSHTASTAGGNYLAPGTVTLGPYPYSPAISGVALHANIIAYDIAGPTGSAYNTDSVAAANQAILDGVDVINRSYGISGNTWTGAVQQAYLSVFNAGIVATQSAGNTGPGVSTIGPVPPWVITVGASTHNRAGINSLVNMTGGSTTPPANLIGKGFSAGAGPAPIVYAGNAPYSDALCQTPAAAGTFAGKIVVCDRGTNARVAKGYNVLQGGAVGMVLANDTASGASLNGDVHWLPAVQITYADGVTLKSWLSTGSGHTGTIAGTTISTAASNGDIMASFSSRGPHTINTLLTPDVTNPGVDILAAYRSGATTAGEPTVEYAISSGTSMSSPMTAGSAALIKALHPTWGPAEIKSALMDTGKFQGILKEDGVTAAIPFDMGTGRVDLTQAGNAGLVLNETGANFNAANPATGGDPKTLNLASLANPACATACTWTRTVKATRAGTWTATYITPAGMTLQVTPSTFTLAAGATQQLNIQANVSGLPTGTYAFGYVVLTQSTAEAGETIHLTVAVNPVAGQATITVNPSSLSATQATNTTTSQTLTIGNTGTTALTWSIAEAPASVSEVIPNVVLWDQPASGTSGGVSDYSTTQNGGAYSANDFTLTSAAQVTSIFADGFDNSNTLVNQPSIRWVIYPNNAGVPAGHPQDGGGTEIWSFSAAPTAVGVDITNNKITLNLPAAGAPALNLAPGTYWLVVYPTYNNNITAGSSPRWNWFMAAPVGTPAKLIDPSNLFGAGITTWTSWSSLSATIQDLAFRLEGSQASTCQSPQDIPWVLVAPSSGTTGAGGSSPVNVTFDSTGLAVGTYNAKLCVNSNDPTTPLVEVPVSLTVQGGQPPNIDVTPASLSSTQATNTTTQQTLNVGNTGGSALNWTIFEDATGAAPELVDWSDNFDSYATGSQLHGQGGWKGWADDPAAGALASNAQARSVPNSAAILGASDLVHEYAETDGQWVYTAWQYLPANFAGQSYFILLNTYNDAGSGLNWSTQLCFDAASGLLYDDVPGDCSGTSTLPLVTGQWVEIRVEIDLDADTQAIYYNNQLLVQDTWSGHVSGGGTTTIAAVDLFANNASTVYYDDLSLVASTQAVACDAPADIPWVSVSPTNGTTPAAGSSPVTVTFNSTGLANGTYTGNLCVDSNDPNPGPGNGTDLVIVPLTLTVQQPTAVTLSGLAADDASPVPMPVTVPMSTLPAAVAAAFAVAVALRRRR